MEKNDYGNPYKRLGKSPTEWLQERGFVKTVLGWMPQIKWTELVNKGAVASSRGTWMLSYKYNPNSVVKFVNGKGSLELIGVKSKKGDSIGEFLNGLS